MKTTHRVKIRGFALAVAFGASLSFLSPAFGQTFSSYLIDPNGEVTKLGGSGIQPIGINNAGQVVGVASTAEGSYHAFITGPNGVGRTNLGTPSGVSLSGASDVNDIGHVVGYFRTADGSDHAFITGAGGVGMTALSPVPYTDSSAHAINNMGQVAGTFGPVAFITGPDGVGVTNLGGLEGGGSGAYGINDAGQVVGYSYVGLDIHAFITGPDGLGMTDLGTLGQGYSSAKDVNNAGQVVGESSTAEGFYHAFITGANGLGMIDLGTLGGADSFAEGVNNAGQVVGHSGTASGPFFNPDYHAFITGPDGKGMVDLNSLVSLPVGEILVNAVDINDRGQIIAVSTIPEPASYALMFAGLGLVGFMARGRRRTRVA